MSLQIRIIPHTLQFKFDARTSRGAMPQHQVYYLSVSETDHPERLGIGECAPLPGLSMEYKSDFYEQLQIVIQDLNKKLKQEKVNVFDSKVYLENLKHLPSVVFALETAALDLEHGGDKQIFANAFSAGEFGIPINGLIWMGDKTFMQEQIQKKLQEGYSCLKLKIGGLDFATELQILKSIRQVAPATDLIIRLDANGAFTPAEALSKLNKLAAFQIHSIEQPIRQEQYSKMQHICQHSPIPVALDEELIGVIEIDKKEQLLQTLKPQFIILKPTLLGGFQACSEWISLAEKAGISWWITSALESNIGLNAVSQFTAEYPVTMEQGLGTGQLYHNNLSSPLEIDNGKLFYRKNQSWDNALFY